MGCLNVSQTALEFFKIVKEMIDSRSTCSEILKVINKQPYEIKSLFEGEPLRTLKLGGDKVLKNLFNKGEIAGGTSEKPYGEDLRTGSPFVLNKFDHFDFFIKNSIKELEKKNYKKKN